MPEAKKRNRGTDHRLPELGALLKKYFTEEDIGEIIDINLFSDKEVKTLNEILEEKRKK